MANQLNMAEIGAILTLHKSEHSNRAISKLLEVNRGTVGKYVAQAEAQNRPNAPTGSEVADGSGPTPTGGTSRPGSASGPPSECEPFREQILAKVGQLLQPCWSA